MDKEEFLTRMGKNIEALRVKQGITAEQLADRLGKSPNYILKIESGKSNSSLKEIVQIAVILGVKVDTLFD